MQDITDQDGAAEAAAAAEPAMPHEIPADICVVDTPAEARRIVQLIKTQYSGMLFACDTEVGSMILSPAATHYQLTFLKVLQNRFVTKHF